MKYKELIQRFRGSRSAAGAKEHHMASPADSVADTRLESAARASEMSGATPLSTVPALSGLDLAAYRTGVPQRSGPMTVLPLFGPDRNGRFTTPLSGLKLSGVRGYGNMELSNLASSGVAILPLHMGYIQRGVQNHALCRSAFIGAGQKVMFQDACCVQAAQGGYLEEREQWFFILPLQLRASALELRGVHNFGKLWEAISHLNSRYGLPVRGHLEQLLVRERPYLTQYQSRFELLPGQTGAVFFLGEKLVGVEIAPGAAYFAEVWMPLVCFCYGASAMEVERRSSDHAIAPEPFQATNLGELRAALESERQAMQENMHGWLQEVPPEKLQPKEEERFLDFRLQTISGTSFAGQYVEEKGELVYASVFARPEYLT